MKKIMVMVVVCAMALIALTACGKKKYEATCTGCSETKQCADYVVTMDGQSENATLCDDCYKSVKAIVDLAKQMGTDASIK